MSLVKYNRKTKESSWNFIESTQVKNQLPKIETISTIDYDKLDWLCNIEGLKSRERPETTKDAHDEFMQNYKKMFVSKSGKTKSPISTARKSIAASGTTTNAATHSSSHSDKSSKLIEPEQSHNIKDYMRFLHKERLSENPVAVRAENIRSLRKLLKKYPFERTAAENDKIFSILQTFDFFKENVQLNVLKELCVVAQLETWKEQDFVVYGKTGIHMILKGSVKPLCEPFLVPGLDGSHPQAFIALTDTTVEQQEQKLLEVGDCFGTWLSYDDPFSKEFSVLTKDANCEFLKISANDFSRVNNQIAQREHTEKLNLLLSCEQYRTWPKQPLNNLADCIEWTSYPPNTVLMSEGYKSPFVGFIRAGQCHVLRQVEVQHTLKSGKKEPRTKQVVMGKLGRYHSFAEISILLDEPITCSVITATHVKLGVIKPEKLDRLDDVTRQLFHQSNSRTFGDLTKEDIQNEYVNQEMKKEWNQFKHAQVLEVINSQGIRPGFGKWAK